MRHGIYILSALCFSTIQIALSQPKLSPSELKTERQTILRKLGKRPDFFLPWRCESQRSVVLERVQVAADRKTLHLYCNVGLAQIAIRQERLDEWAAAVRKKLGPDYERCDIRFYAYKIPAERFIPNYFRPEAERDPKRTSRPIDRPPLVRRTDRSLYGRGLGGRHLALWGGHGYYYHEEEDSAWTWQRPALFGTIEDLNTQEFASRYLAPMLENAGAVVVMARERDPQQREIIIDNDSSTGNARIDTVGHWTAKNGGFIYQDTLRTQNPFRQGTVLQAEITAELKPSITYVIGLDESGEYGVYVSWKAQPGNLTGARYTVYHAGGKAEFEVNQRIGGSMWVWLGRFVLDSTSRIVLSAPDKATTGTLIADAVKIGGGIGNVERAGTVSGVSRYAEAARYWMQYCGVPDSIYAQETLSIENKEHKLLDYTDNFKGNGDWCNYIRRQKGIPLDLALGLHTDAGICDSIVGTLAIHYTDRCRAHYTNGKSKLAGRDLADLVQTQIVTDLRAKYDSTWTRRSIYDKSYAEISRPDLPAVLVEMFSHQNANDMALAMDPAFRFDMARAVYKGVLRFLADRYGRSYTVQPLPPSGFRAELIGGDSVRLSWRAAEDPLEPTARPDRYRVYERIGKDGAFDDGREVRFTELAWPLRRDGVLHSYRVTAVNEGGESFPSETLCVGLAAEEQGRALIVNGFTRVSPPALKRDAQGKISGFDMATDPGVPYVRDYAVVGPQLDFDPLSPFEDNHRPGWGASSTEWAGRGTVGNTFDYAAIHGEALLKAGFSVSSISRTAFERMPIRPSQYRMIDLILGAQRSWPARYSIFSPLIVRQLERLIEANVPMVVSGSYIGSDPEVEDSVRKLLGYTCSERIPNPQGMTAGSYHTPAFDRLRPLAGGSTIRMENWPAEGVRNGQTYVFGFPIEVLDSNALGDLFKRLLALE